MTGRCQFYPRLVALLFRYPTFCRVIVLAVFLPFAAVTQDELGEHNGDRDPAIAAVPFDKWLAENNEPQIKWEGRVRSAELAMEQRLRARAEIQVDGDEVAKRKGRGQLVTLVRFQDSQGRMYEGHNVIDLKSVQQATNKLNFVVSQDVYVLPGDYQVSLGVFDTATGDHSVTRRTLHVNAVKNDPLPALWRGLPAVEMVTNQPFKTHKINFPLETKQPLHVELLVNMSPSLEPPALRTLPIPPDTVLNNLVSVLGVLTQMEVRNGSFHVEALNLTRRKILRQQDIRPGESEMDWETLFASLKEADPNVIDVGTLKNRGHGVEFFGKQVRRAIGESGADSPETPGGAPQRVLIVLTPPFVFSGEDTRPMELETPTNTRVYYLRRHSKPPADPFDLGLDDRRFGRTRRIDPAAPVRGQYAEPVDTLDRVLKPLKPKNFDIYTADDLRKALATIMEEISRL